MDTVGKMRTYFGTGRADFHFVCYTQKLSGRNYLHILKSDIEILSSSQQIVLYCSLNLGMWSGVYVTRLIAMKASWHFAH